MRIVNIAKHILPTSWAISLQYYFIFKKFPNLHNPKTFNEKLQWLKIHDHNPDYVPLVDKYEVKQYIADLLGPEYIIPNLGVWDSVDDIDFDALPNQFVLKCTHDSGSVVICRDKSNFNQEAAKTKLRKHMKQNLYYYGREWAYKDVKPRILGEMYMDDGNNGLRDYKFFNFNGVPQFIYLSEGLENHETASISFYDLELNEMPFHRSDFKPFKNRPLFPSNMKEMEKLSEIIAQKIPSPFLRTDFYSINGKVYFSEITFCPCSGLLPFAPAEWDRKLGDLIQLK